MPDGNLKDVGTHFKRILRRRGFRAFWNSLLILLPWAAVFACIPSVLRILRLYYINPFLGSLIFIPAVCTAAVKGTLSRIPSGTNILFLDREMGLKERLVTFYDYTKREKTDNPFYNLLRTDTIRKVKEAPVKKLYPLKKGKPLAAALSLIMLFFALSSAAIAYQGRTQPDSPEEVLLIEAGRRLTLRARDSEEISSLARKIEQLGKDMDMLTDKQAEEETQVLREEVARQIRDLQRNSITSLLEEKKIDRKAAEALNSLLQEELTLDEIKELALNLFASETLSGEQKKAMQKSFEKFDEAPKPGGQSELAENIMEGLSPEESGGVSALKEAEEALKKAAERLRGKRNRENQEESGTGGPPSEESAGRGGNGEELESGGGDETGPAALPGKEEASREESPAPFNPLTEEREQARLPEGTIGSDPERGVLRVNPDENFSLPGERAVVPDYETQRESVIRQNLIPEPLREIVKEYFAQLGEPYTEKQD